MSKIEDQALVFTNLSKLLGILPHSLTYPEKIHHTVTYFLHIVTLITFQLYCHISTYNDEKFEDASDKFLLSNVLRVGSDLGWHIASTICFLLIIVTFFNRNLLIKHLADINNINKKFHEMGLEVATLSKYKYRIHLLVVCIIGRSVSIFYNTVVLYNRIGVDCDWRLNFLIVCNDLYLELIIWQFIGLIVLIRDLVTSVNNCMLCLCERKPEFGQFFQVSSTKIEISTGNNVVNYVKSSGYTGSFVKSSVSYSYNDENELAETVQKLTILHERITDAANNLSDCYAYQLLLSISVIFVGILFGTYYVYKYFTELENNPDPAITGRILIMTLYYQLVPIIGLAVIVVCCCRVTDQVQETAVFAHRLINQSSQPGLISRLHSLSLQVLHHSARFSACGFPLDRTLFFSFFATAVTYLIILTQFEVVKPATTILTNLPKRLT